MFRELRSKEDAEGLTTRLSEQLLGSDDASPVCILTVIPPAKSKAKSAKQNFFQGIPLLRWGYRVRSENERREQFMNLPFPV